MKASPDRQCIDAGEQSNPNGCLLCIGHRWWLLLLKLAARIVLVDL
jgi:hypothetical protein